MRSFAVTWDYRCPFARNAHERLLTALEDGADWDVRFVAFSLDQPHIEDGEAAVWDEPDRYPGMLANLAGIVVRDREPDRFRSVHRALFAARHDQALDTRDRDILTKVLHAAGVDGAWVMSEIDSGWPMSALRVEHTDAADRLAVFGVPTFIVGDTAVYIRLMDRTDDPRAAKAEIERILDLIADWPSLNEFKYTTLEN
jgi:hypothetical protein